MDTDRVTLPENFRQRFYSELDSTNAEGLRLLAAGEDGNQWVWALHQTGGRGRHGRRWQSLAGNLFASLTLRPQCAAHTASQLGFVGALAVHDAVVALAGKNQPDLKLKWPNDLLLNGKKAAGLLLESTSDGAGRLSLVLGVGLNLAAHPQDVPFPSTDLACHGIDVNPREALEALADKTAKWLSVWNDGAGFEEIRTAWDERSLPKGTALQVRVGDDRLNGLYRGLDQTGGLMLVQDDGSERRITTGDVFPL
ncbi:MAG: biotin--[acetyl-CoA-carboxylase] ligase [Hyphomicrobiaceae bacterium]|nr:biotin--[acetyl-CoA-carboxylase] ligase [Hyphomicrobiaceae bacterium]